jgi:hypothetical protein
VERSLNTDTSRLVGIQEARGKQRGTEVLFGKFSDSHQLEKGVFVRNLITTGAKISQSVGYRLSHWCYFIVMNARAPLN